jgi:hypothetical protein
MDPRSRQVRHPRRKSRRPGFSRIHHINRPISPPRRGLGQPENGRARAGTLPSLAARARAPRRAAALPVVFTSCAIKAVADNGYDLPTTQQGTPI